MDPHRLLRPQIIKDTKADPNRLYFYLALDWAQALADQSKDPELKTQFIALARDLSDNEAKINAELLGAQGHAVDLGGYYQPDPAKAERAMRPSPTLNAIVESLS